MTTNPLREYGDAHRMFVQSIMKRGVLNSNEVFDLIKLVCKKQKIPLRNDTVGRNEDRAKFLKCIKAKLENLGFTLKNIADEEELNDNGSKISYLAFSNNTDRSSDENGVTLKAMVTFQAFEIDYLKVIVAGIMNSELRVFKTITALNAFRQVKVRKFDMKLAQSILDKFVQHKWFIAQDGKIRFHPRFIAEMDQWLRDVYPDKVWTCCACPGQKLVVRAFKCPNSKCHGVYHRYCILLPKSKDKGRCKICKSEIDLKPFEIHREVEEAEPLEPHTSRKSPRKRATRKRKVDESETEESEPVTETDESDEN